MMFRKLAVCVVPALALCVLVCGILTPEDEKPAPEDQKNPEVTQASLDAVRRGQQYLAEHQSQQGSFGGSYPVAITSLAGLALLGSGDSPGCGKYGANITKAVIYLMKAANRRGYISEPGGSQSRMHGHGYAMLFLAEVYGMTRDVPGVEEEQLRTVIQRAVKLTEDSQSRTGGWYYEPSPSGEENSITITRNAGFLVRKSTIDKGIQYVKKCANKDGSYKYSLSMGNSGGTFALTSGAVACLYFYGEQTDKCPEIQRGIEFMNKFRPDGKESGAREGYYFYANFYAIMSMNYAGGKQWQTWWPALRDELVKKQGKDGSWVGGDVGDPCYCTAFACLMLQVPHRILPIFQTW
jgi:hypothetical protein